MGKTNWRCRCCDMPVRHTPYSGRKSLPPIDLYKEMNYQLINGNGNPEAEKRTS